jgi:hypothetical protein
MNDNNNRDWSIDINLSGVSAPTGNTNVTQGYYKAKVTDMYVRPEKPGRVVIKLTIAEGDFAGAVRTTGLNIPKSDDDKVRYYWRGLAESVGYGAAELDAGSVNLSMGSFEGRIAHVFYTPKEMSSDGYDSIDFLPPVPWGQKAAAFTPSAGGNGGAAPSGSALGSTGNNNASGTTSASEVRARLGL